jgi:hypothetical protein
MGGELEAHFFKILLMGWTVLNCNTTVYSQPHVFCVDRYADHLRLPPPPPPPGVHIREEEGRGGGGGVGTDDISRTGSGFGFPRSFPLGWVNPPTRKLPLHFSAGPPPMVFPVLLQLPPPSRLHTSASHGIRPSRLDPYERGV